MHSDIITLKNLVYRYRLTKKMLKSHKGDAQATTVLEKQLKRHTDDIIEYVTSDSFQVALNNLNL